MKKRIALFVLAATVIGLGFATASSGPGSMIRPAAEHGETVTVFGYVDVAAEDATGRVTEVYIDDSKQGVFLVADDAKGRELLQLVDRLVEATGIATEIEDDDFDFLLRVTSYELEDDEDDEDDEEPDDDDDDGPDDDDDEDRESR